MDENGEKYIVTRQEIDEFQGINKTHFLNDNARRMNKSLGDLTGLTGMGFHIIEVEPGFATTELHRHFYEDECVYILEGEAEAYIGEQTCRVGAGDFIGYRAGGAAHKLVNSGSSVLKCIVAGQRLDHDVADYPEQGKRLFRNRGMRWNLVDDADIGEPVAGNKT